MQTLVVHYGNTEIRDEWNTENAHLLENYIIIYAHSGEVGGIMLTLYPA